MAWLVTKKVTFAWPSVLSCSIRFKPGITGYGFYPFQPYALFGIKKKDRFVKRLVVSFFRIVFRKDKKRIVNV
ncbi:MAG: hypothetical protein CSA26_05220 [Desulfobacterales bacterium]|nr:MAG: hypothetical protein CSA26_05220 [Desulfobacterales bacterium]